MVVGTKANATHFNHPFPPQSNFKSYSTTTPSIHILPLNIHSPSIVRAERRMDQQIRKDLLHQRSVHRSPNRILHSHRNKIQVSTFRLLIARRQYRHQCQNFTQNIFLPLVSLSTDSRRRTIRLVDSASAPSMGWRRLKTGSSYIIRQSSCISEYRRITFGS